MPNIDMYNVVKNNKTPNGPISIGEVKSRISIKAASPRILTYNIVRLYFITLLYHNWFTPPRFFIPRLGEGVGLSGAKNHNYWPQPLPTSLFFDRFTHRWSIDPCCPFLPFLFMYLEGTNERFDCALDAFSGALGNSYIVIYG